MFCCNLSRVNLFTLCPLHGIYTVGPSGRRSHRVNPELISGWAVDNTGVIALDIGLQSLYVCIQYLWMQS